MARRFGETFPVRMSPDTNARIKRVAKAVGLSKSDVLRMAMAHGLPLVEAGKLSLTSHTESPSAN